MKTDFQNGPYPLKSKFYRGLHLVVINPKSGAVEVA